MQIRHLHVTTCRQSFMLAPTDSFLLYGLNMMVPFQNKWYHIRNSSWHSLIFVHFEWRFSNSSDQSMLVLSFAKRCFIVYTNVSKEKTASIFITSQAMTIFFIVYKKFVLPFVAKFVINLSSFNIVGGCSISDLPLISWIVTN